MPDVIKMVPVVPLFSTEHPKRKILALSQELKEENKCKGYFLEMISSNYKIR